MTGLALRPIRLDDCDALLGWVNDPAVVGNFATMGEITREQELAYLEGILASKTDRLWAVMLDDRTIGTAGIHKIWWPARNGRLGLVIGAKDVHGRGVGTAAMRALVAKGFDELGLHKLWLVHYATNAKMHHLAKKLGMVEEGVLRDEYWNDGAFHDMVRHSILEGEYRASRAPGG